VKEFQKSSVDYSTPFRRSIDGIDFTSSLKCDTD